MILMDNETHVHNGRHDRATAPMSHDSMRVLHVQHPIDLLPVKYNMNITIID